MQHLHRRTRLPLKHPSFSAFACLCVRPTPYPPPLPHPFHIYIVRPTAVAIPWPTINIRAEAANAEHHRQATNNMRNVAAVVEATAVYDLEDQVVTVGGGGRGSAQATTIPGAAPNVGRLGVQVQASRVAGAAPTVIFADDPEESGFKAQLSAVRVLKVVSVCNCRYGVHAQLYRRYVLRLLQAVYYTYSTRL